MGHCCIIGCKTDSRRKISGISSHKFPDDAVLRNLWITATGRKDWVPKHDARVCSLHFDKNLLTRKGKKTFLHVAAVPNKVPSTSTTKYRPSTSELQYQPIATGNDRDQSEIAILLKEELTDEEKNQCRLCLSVGRRMQELGEYAPLYRKLLFDDDYQNTTPSLMYKVLACWECHAELRAVERFQDKVRRAHNAFVSRRNQNREGLSKPSTNIDEYQEPNNEEYVQDIKEEVEIEIEEHPLPDPLDVKQPQEVAKINSASEIIKNEPNITVTQKAVKRTKPAPKRTENILKRLKLDQNIPNIEQAGPKTSQEEEFDPKSIAETDSDAIFTKVKIEIDELDEILEERRNKVSFKSMKFRCDSCIHGFTDYIRLLEHNRNFHDEDFGNCECDICKRRFADERQLSAHHRNHFVKFVCKLCNFECYTKTGRTIHFKRHKGALRGTSINFVLRQSSREPST